MRLTFVIKSLCVKGGGAERVLTTIANELAARGHSISVITFDDSTATPFYVIDDRIELSGIALARTDKPLTKIHVLNTLPRLKRNIIVTRPDLVVAFMHSAYVPTSLSLMGSGLPLILSEHTSAAHFAARPLQRLFANVSFLLAKAKTVPSKNVWLEHAVSQRHKVHVLPNPLDLQSFPKRIDRTEKHEQVVLAVGGFRPEKDHQTLIRAFAMLAENFPDWKLRLVGDGELRKPIVALILKLNLGNRIALAGWQDDVGDEYASARFLVVPSQYEAFGLVAAEALANGCPVVGFANCAGTSELIDHDENGRLVGSQPTRAEALANAMAALMSDQALLDRYAKNAAGSVRRFDLPHVADIWENFLVEQAPPLDRDNPCKLQEQHS